MAAAATGPAPAQNPAGRYGEFLADDFDAHAYAHSVVEQRQLHQAAPTPAGASTSARLDDGVQDLTHQLRQLVHRNHPALLLHAATLATLGGDLAQVRAGLLDVQNGVHRVTAKVQVPHHHLDHHLRLLDRTRTAARLAKHALRYTALVRRLHLQLRDLRAADSSRATTERALAEAALTLAELDVLLREPPPPPPDLSPATNGGPESAAEPPAPAPAPAHLRQLDIVLAHVPTVESARVLVTERMQSGIDTALDNLDQPLLASSLQTAHNLSVLPTVVQDLVAEQCEKVVEVRVKEAFDMAAIAKLVGQKDQPSMTSAASSFVYKSRLRTEPTAANLALWQQTFWSRLEALVDELGSVCIRTYALERVLKVKRDLDSQESFLDEALTVLDNKPSALFWTSLTRALETQTRETARNSSFVQSTLSTSYPRLLRLFQEFFSKIAVHTDTVYTLAQQSPETILTLRAIQPFEALYLARSRTRLNDAVQSAFSISSGGGGGLSSSGAQDAVTPTANEGLQLARAVVNELDAARFDPLLARAVAKNSARAVEAFVGRAEALIARDYSATSLLGPVATPSQLHNADLTSALYHLGLPLERALADHIESVRELLRPAVERARTTYVAIVKPLILAIRREFSALLARMHRTNYAADAATGEPGRGRQAGVESGGASAYMTDLTDKLTLVKDEILGAYRVGELARDWALDVARFIVQTFLLHASLLRVGESGRLRVTNDTTTLEFAVTQYLSAHGLALNSMGDQFKAVRAFRPLLFRDLSALGDPSGASGPYGTNDVPTLILLHHLLARGGLALPHQLRGWSETEYVRWLNEHQEEERIALVEEVVERERGRLEVEREGAGEGTGEGEEGGKDGSEAKQSEAADAEVALQLVDKVLARYRRPGGGATAAQHPQPR